MFFGHIVANHRLRHLTTLQTTLVNYCTLPVSHQDKVTDRLPFLRHVRPGGTYLGCCLRTCTGSGCSQLEDSSGLVMFSGMMDNFTGQG